MLAAIPVASAWQRREMIAPALREFLPAVLSMTSVVAALLCVVHQIVPFYGGGVAMTRAFQDDIAGRTDAFAPAPTPFTRRTVARSHALRRRGVPLLLLQHPLGVAGILLFTVALMGGILLLRRAGDPRRPLTVMCTFLALLGPMLSEYARRR